VTLKAGAFAVDISPNRPTALFGYPHVPRISTGVHDPLWSSALYLADGAGGAVLIALDLLFVDPPTARAIRRAVAERVEVPEAQVFISCTHTHSGPVTSRLLAWDGDPAVPLPDPEYLNWLAQCVAESAARAAALARPAEIAWTAADARGVGGNRLSSGGATDPEAGVLAVREPGGGPWIAAAVVYGMHPTVLHEDSTLVSSDFPHYARQQLREQFGESLVVLYHTAPCGNQSPRFFVRGQTFGEAERLGRMLGRSVGASLAGIKDQAFQSRGPLAGILRAVELCRRTFPSVAQSQPAVEQYRAEYHRLKAAQADPAGIRTAECAVFGAEGTLTLARLEEAGQVESTLQAYRPIEIQAVRIGEGCLVGLPGELFIEYSLDLKRRWPNKVSVVSLVNGHLQGYVVTQEAADAGGYEALSSVFDGPTSGQRLMQAADEVLAVLMRR
jgi:neutral ceramidase